MSVESQNGGFIWLPSTTASVCVLAVAMARSALASRPCSVSSAGYFDGIEWSLLVRCLGGMYIENRVYDRARSMLHKGSVNGSTNIENIEK